MQSDRPLVSIKNWREIRNVTSPCLILCVIPYATLTCYIQLRYDVCYHCHDHKEALCGVQGASLRAEGGQLRGKCLHKSKSLKKHSGLTFGCRWFVCLFACSFTSLSSAATQPELWQHWQAGRVIQGHNEADGRRQNPTPTPPHTFTSPCTFPLTAKEAAAPSSSPANSRACGRKIIVFNHVLLVTIPPHPPIPSPSTSPCKSYEITTAKCCQSASGKGAFSYM